MPLSYLIKLMQEIVVSGCQLPGVDSSWLGFPTLALEELEEEEACSLGEMLHPEIFEAADFQKQGKENERHLPFSFFSNLQVVLLSWEERCHVLSRTQECYSSRGCLHDAVRLFF